MNTVCLRSNLNDYHYVTKIGDRVVGASEVFDNYEKCYLAAKARAVKSGAKLVVEQGVAK